jgi:hypothetical protein
MNIITSRGGDELQQLMLINAQYSNYIQNISKIIKLRNFTLKTPDPKPSIFNHHFFFISQIFRTSSIKLPTSIKINNLTLREGVELPAHL